jgi:hypothetical protein
MGQRHGAETRFLYPFVPLTYCIGGRYEWVVNSSKFLSLNEIPGCGITYSIFTKAVFGILESPFGLPGIIVKT